VKSLFAFAMAVSAFAQMNPLTVFPPTDPVMLKRGGAAANAKIKLSLRQGFHCNTNTPSDEYLIPLKLTFAAAGGVESAGVVNPKGKDEKYEFSAKPLNVYSGEFEIGASFKAAKDAPKGPAKFVGKLRFQACNDKMCFAPKTLEVTIPVQVSD
jgi:thioredoxin:protein disulfide reductase